MTLTQSILIKEDNSCLFVFFKLSALDLVPYSKPCVGHNSKTIWNIFIEAMCNEYGRQLLLIWFMNYLPLTTYVTFF